MSGQYDWVDFYKEFANKLLGFKSNRAELISIIRSAYDEAGISLPTIMKKLRAQPPAFSISLIYSKPKSSI